MKKKQFRKLLIVTVAVVVGFSSCVAADQPPRATPTADEGMEAAAVLRDYFEALSRGEYGAAVGYYGGSYQVLQDNNPGLDPEGFEALFQNACKTNGFQCLAVHDVLDVRVISPGAFEISANFVTRDGDLFVRDPCCGASEEEMQPESVFEFRVVKNGAGAYQVMDLPVYVP